MLRMLLIVGLTLAALIPVGAAVSIELAAPAMAGNSSCGVGC
jgi:hypothetical protein